MRCVFSLFLDEETQTQRKLDIWPRSQITSGKAGIWISGSLGFISVVPRCLSLGQTGPRHVSWSPWQSHPLLVKCFPIGRHNWYPIGLWFISFAWEFSRYLLFFRTQCWTDPRRNWRSCEQHCETFSQTWERGMMSYKTQSSRILKLLLYMVHKAIQSALIFICQLSNNCKKILPSYLKHLFL